MLYHAGASQVGQMYRLEVVYLSIYLSLSIYLYLFTYLYLFIYLYCICRSVSISRLDRSSCCTTPGRVRWHRCTWGLLMHAPSRPRRWLVRVNPDDDDDCLPPRDTSPHQDSTDTAPGGTPPPAQPPPPPQTWETQSHSAPTPLKRPMLTPEGGPRPRVSA